MVLLGCSCKMGHVYIPVSLVVQKVGCCCCLLCRELMLPIGCRPRRWAQHCSLVGASLRFEWLWWVFIQCCRWHLLRQRFIRCWCASECFPLAVYGYQVGSGSPSLIHDSLMSVLENESYARCMSHDDMNISEPVTCAVTSTAWKWMRAAEHPHPGL